MPTSNQALAFAPPHLSLYHLTIEPNTVFALQASAGLPDDDLASDDARPRSPSAPACAGLERYEVSAFARPGHRCRHNLNYWRSATTSASAPARTASSAFPHRIVRQVRWREPAAYMQQGAGRSGGE